MSICPEVIEQDLINLSKLAEQQQNQRAFNIKNTLSKQTHDKSLAENLSTITENLENIKESTKKLGKVIENLILKLKIVKR